MSRNEAFQEGSGEPPFREENGVLHVGGKPFHFARHLGTAVGNDEPPYIWHEWEVPFESGHVVRISNYFHAKTGRPLDNDALGMLMGAHHEPTIQNGDTHKNRTTGEKIPSSWNPSLYHWEPPNDTPSSINTTVEVKTPEEFHQRLNEVASLPGSSKENPVAARNAAKNDEWWANHQRNRGQ